MKKLLLLLCCLLTIGCGNTNNYGITTYYENVEWYINKDSGYLYVEKYERVNFEDNLIYSNTFSNYQMVYRNRTSQTILNRFYHYTSGLVRMVVYISNFY